MKTKFIVTLVVLSLVCAAPRAFPQPGNRVLTEILSDYVYNGFVDYQKLCKDDRLKKYIELLKAIDPDTISDREERLAFWINVYNASTLSIVCDNYPVESIVDIGFGGLALGQVLGTTVWHKDLVTVHHKTISLNNVEHDTIRGKFDEPRVHFALVCAARSCPPLRNAAYAADRLDEQLDDQGRIFLNDPAKNWYDLEKKEAHISKVFDWYGSDFGDSDAEILAFISRYLPEDIRDSIKKDPASWSVSYTDYDWSLNDMNSR